MSLFDLHVYTTTFSNDFLKITFIGIAYSLTSICLDFLCQSLKL